MDNTGYSLLEELFGSKEFPPDVNTQFARVLLMIVGGDGVISAAEWSYLAGKAKVLGVPNEEIESWNAIDYRSGDLSTEAKRYWNVLGMTANDLFYEAVKMSSVDGYTERERNALRISARSCGVPESVVQQIENLCALEDRVREMRISLLFPGGAISRSAG